MELAPVYLAFILMLAIFLGFELISKVPATLHTPLMSGANPSPASPSSVRCSRLGRRCGARADPWGRLAVTFATINVVGGYLVTDRMLGMFKKKGD